MFCFFNLSLFCWLNKLTDLNWRFQRVIVFSAAVNLAHKFHLEHSENLSKRSSEVLVLKKKFKKILKSRSGAVSGASSPPAAGARARGLTCLLAPVSSSLNRSTIPQVHDPLLTPGPPLPPPLLLLCQGEALSLLLATSPPPLFCVFTCFSTWCTCVFTCCLLCQPAVVPVLTLQFVCLSI